MVSKLVFIWQLLKETVLEFSKDKAFRHGAAIAYYTIFSLPAILIIMIRFAGKILGEEEVKHEILRQIELIFGSQGLGNVERMIESLQSDPNTFWTTILGLGVLIFGATRTFYSLQDSINSIWKIRQDIQGNILTLIFDRLLSFAMLVTLGFILLVSMVLETLIVALRNFINDQMITATELLIQFFPDNPDIAQQVMKLLDYIYLLDIFLLLFIITLVFALIFKILPSAQVKWKDIWLGAFVTAVLFSAGKFIIGWYIGNTDLTTTYGAAGDILVILLWVYYSAQIMLFGAELIYVYTRKKGREIQASALTQSLTNEPLARFILWLRWLTPKPEPIVIEEPEKEKQETAMETKEV